MAARISRVLEREAALYRESKRVLTINRRGRGIAGDTSSGVRLSLADLLSARTPGFYRTIPAARCTLIAGDRGRVTVF